MRNNHAVEEVINDLMVLPTEAFINNEADHDNEEVRYINKEAYSILCCKHDDRDINDIKTFQEAGFDIDVEEDDCYGYAIVNITYPDGERTFRVY